MMSNLNEIVSLLCLIAVGSALAEGDRGQVLYFDISDFHRSHHISNVRAQSCCFSLDEVLGFHPKLPPAVSWTWGQA